jgi:hypothetical protein
VSLSRQHQCCDRIPISSFSQTAGQKNKENTDQTSNETADDRLLQLDLATGKERKKERMKGGKKSPNSLSSF